MDDRQRQVQVGAGLQESRLNTDLIRWLEQYSSWILGVLLAVVAVYFGWTRYEAWQAERLDTAFVAYDGARGQVGPDGVLQGSPENLLKIAREHDGAAAVWSLANLDAASIYLGAARRGLRPGADLANIKDEDSLTAAQITEMARQADAIYSQVVARNKNSPRRAPIYFRALLGSASAALSLAETDRAREALTELVAVAQREGYTSQAAEAKTRLERLSSLAAAPRLYTDAEIPAPPEPTPKELEERQKLFGLPEGINPPTLDTPTLPIGGSSPAFPDSQPSPSPPTAPTTPPPTPPPAPGE